jgi:bacterioferritin-associated ferredoxin
MIRIRFMIAAMYVCICNGHRDKDIRAAAKSGLRCPRTIYRQLGKPVKCGRCINFATEVIAEVHAAEAANGALAPEAA